MLYPNITLIFFVWVLFLFAVSAFSFYSLPHSGVFQGDFISALANWDGGHFIKIAQFGYQEKYQFAFFPLYPILINFINILLGDYRISALLISFICSFFSLQLFYNLLIKNFSKEVANESVLFLLMFPVSFFFLSAYSESLFFLLMMLVFYFLKEEKLLLATIAGILISVTRITGLAVILILIISVFWKGTYKKNWYVLLSPLGFLLFMFYLYIQTGNPFYFLTAESHWQRQLAIPGVNFWGSINALLMGSLFDNNGYVILLEFISSFFGIGLVLRSFRFLPFSFSAYGLLSILFPFFTSTLMSMPRFLLVIFPVFITISLLRNNIIKYLYRFFCIIFLIIFTALFVNGYWVS